jgi:hypothetical protein
VHEDGEWFAGLDGFRWEIRRKGKQALIHLWSTESNLVRTIHRITDSRPGHIQLEVQRFGRAKPARLASRPPAMIPELGEGPEKEEGKQRLVSQSHFPGCVLECLIV